MEGTNGSNRIMDDVLKDPLGRYSITEHLKVVVPHQLFSMVSGVLMFLLLRPVLGDFPLVFWLAALLIVATLRVSVGVLAKRQLARRSLPFRLILVYVAVTAFCGAVWGSLLFFFPTGQFVFQESLVLGLLFFALVLSAFFKDGSPLIHVAFVAPILVMMLAWSLLQGGHNYAWLSLAVVIYFTLDMSLVYQKWSARAKDLRTYMQGRLLQRDIDMTEASLSRQIQERLWFEFELDSTRSLFRSGPVITYRCEPDNGWPIISISGNVEQFGYSADSLCGRRWDSLLHPDDVSQVEQSVEKFLRGCSEKGLSIECRLKCGDGSYKWVYHYAMPVFQRQGGLSFLDGYFLDMSRVYDAKAELTQEKERAMVTLESIGDAVISTDNEGRIEFMNQVAQNLTGWNCEQSARHSRLPQVFNIRENEYSRWIGDPVAFFQAQSGSGRSNRVQVELCSRTGEHCLVSYNVSPMMMGKRISGYVLVFRDVTETAELLKELEYDARHDELTGIYNRREFESRFQGLMASARTSGKHHVLMYLDLDEFKLVNDTCGHSAGDELLRQLTGIFGAHLDNNAILARLGGDEFGVLLESATAQQGVAIAHRLRDAAKNFSFVWNDRSYEVGVSIGVVSIDSRSESVEVAMGQADVACYAAKDKGRNHVRLYKESDQELRQRRMEMSWATRMNKSMDDGAFSLYYQDIVPVNALGSKGSRRIEILLRLREDGGEIQSAGEFLASAEKYSLMPDIDRWVVKRAFEWYEEFGSRLDIVMNVNLSGLSLTESDFLEYIQQLFKHHDVPPSAVCFEVTETAAIQNLHIAANFMQSLRELGCRFALDDFGSGLSSFEYLKELPVDFLKIDGKFIRNMVTDPVDRAMVDAINNVGHTMNLQTIAEYVENDDIMNELFRVSVDFAQGFGVGMPTPLDSLRHPSQVH